MKELSLREQQLIILDILKYFNNICKKYNINYTLCGGTLIGAIRHKGFIPWDDDIDIYIMREEYEKFLKIWGKEKNNFYILTDTEDYNSISAGYVPKIYDNRTVLSKKHSGMEYGLYIDIFVVDHIPNNLTNSSKVLKRYRKYLFKSLAMRNKSLNTNNIILKKGYLILSKIYFTIIMGILNLIKRIYQNKTNILAPIYDMPIPLEKCIIPDKYFKTFIQVEFEGEFFPIFSEYDEHLRNYYGDYMKLPPEEERIPKHVNTAYLKNS